MAKLLPNNSRIYWGSNNTILQAGAGDSPLTAPFYERCGFVRRHVLKNYRLERYEHPIFEGGKQLIDKVVLRMEL